MKNQIILIVSWVLLIPQYLSAQQDTATFWLSSEEGTLGEGAIIRVNPDLTSAEEKFTFPEADPGHLPYGFPIKAPDDYLYGVTAVGGALGRGSFFRYLESSDEIEYICLGFGADSIGDRPFWSPVDGGNGKIYGLAYDGGENGIGTLFSFDWVQEEFKVEYHFNTTVGGLPFSRPVVSNDGNYLFIYCQSGGISNDGTIVQFEMATGQMTKLFDFQNEILKGPRLTPWLTADNILYGVTLNGGNSAEGGLFKYDLDNSTYTHISDLTFLNGPKSKSASPILVGDKIYAASFNGGANQVGCIYQYDLTNNVGTSLHSFSNSGTQSSSYFPRGNLFLTEDSVLYGLCGSYFDQATQSTSNKNTVYAFDLKSNSFSEEFTCTPDQGNNARNGLNMIDGQLYGMSTYGGYANEGTLFRYNPNLKTMNVLFAFGTQPKGRYPTGQLIELLDGQLVGRVSAGTAHNRGGVFSYSIGSNEYKLIHEYAQSESENGADYYEHSNGNYYRMTVSNGDSLNGSIEVFDPIMQTVNTEFSFDDEDSFGYGGRNQLLELPDGQLLVITDYSNLGNAWGTAFTYNPITKTRTKLVDWNQDSLSGGTIQLLMAPNGLIYYHGSANGPFGLGGFGSINLNTNSVQVLENFIGLPNADGAGHIFFNADSSAIYCTKEAGGLDENSGAIFRYSIAENKFTFMTEPNASQGRLYRNKPYQLNDTSWVMLLDDNGQNLHEGAIATWDGLGNGPSVVYKFTDIRVISHQSQLTRICDLFKGRAEISLTQQGNDYTISLPPNAGSFEVALGNDTFSSNKQLSIPNGPQIIRVRNSMGCEVRFTTNFNVGIQTINDNEFELYPNPSEGRVVVQAEQGLYHLRIWSMDGKILQKFDLQGNQEVDLNLEELLPGMYFMQHIREDGSMHTKQLVVH